MNEYLKLFNTHQEYEEYIEDGIIPNVSYCKDQYHLHYNEKLDPRITAVFEVDDISSPTQILHSSSDLSKFQTIEIDGVVQENLSITYQFETTGLHTVKYVTKSESNLTNATFRELSIKHFDTGGYTKYFGDATLAACPKLETIIIGPQVNNIGWNFAQPVLSGQSQIPTIKTVTFLGVRPPSSDWTYEHFGKTEFLLPEFKIYVPDESLQTYKTNTYFSYYHSYMYPISEKPTE